jgi:DNA-binding XRE family transcriptional regulator
VIGLVLLAAVLGFYFRQFNGPLSPDPERWGQFGDYLGGTLNPLLAFLSLIALVLTVSMQRRQLEIAREQLSNSREELEATRAELARTADAQTQAARALEVQSKSLEESTRLSALSASLTVVDSLMSEAKRLHLDRDGSEYQLLLKQRERLLSAVFEITSPLKH